MRTGLVVLVLVIAAIIAGCITLSPEIVMPKTRIAVTGPPDVNDCFFRVNDSAHSEDTGSSPLIRVTGYISNTCSQPMDDLFIRGMFYGSNGREFAATETYIGHLGFNEVAAFNLSIDTPYSGPYTYRLQPLIREQKKLF
nr:hypothetical protein [uncultured Methanoregula sp.]